jgi:hypothetical protein
MQVSPPDTWVYTGGANALLDGIIGFLQQTTIPAAIPGAWIAIDGTDTVWYNRVTFDFNDYWVRQLRR